MVVATAIALGCIIGGLLVVAMRRRARHGDGKRHDEIAAKLGIDPATLRLVVSAYERRGMVARGIVVAVAGAEVFILRKRNLAVLYRFAIADLISPQTERQAGAPGAVAEDLGAERLIILAFREGERRRALTIDTIWTPANEKTQLVQMLLASP